MAVTNVKKNFHMTKIFLNTVSLYTEMFNAKHRI